MKLYVITILLLIAASKTFAVDDSQWIKPGNPAINYVGRFDFSKDGQVSYDWPGTYIRCRFTGKSIGLKLEGNKDISYNVFIDNLPVKVITTPENGGIWLENTLKPGTHTLRIYKRTEAVIGVSVFKGLMIDNKADVLPWETAPRHRIEFIGNSITCGYGTEGANKNEHFKPSTENNYYSYAAYLSRAFGADYSIIAHSGMGVVRNYGDSLNVSVAPQMPDRFLRVLDSDNQLKWDFSQWKPDVVVINLGTNDFSTHPYPDKVIFQRTYEKLVLKIREVYGDIPVICLVGPMIDEPCFSYVKESVENLKIYNKDKHIYFTGIPIALLNTDDDLGSDSHPSVKGQRKMAAFIAPVISTITGWSFDME
jgi:lysophospholipase L1-like esterase